MKVSHHKSGRYTASRDMCGKHTACGQKVALPKIVRSRGGSRGSLMRRLLASVLIVSLTTISLTAFAAQEKVLGRPDMDVVFVWKDSASNSEALKLISAGVHNRNPELIMRLLSCVAKPGDKAVVTDGGFASSTIVVTSGKSAGCRGVVHNEDLK